MKLREWTRGPRRWSAVLAAVLLLTLLVPAQSAAAAPQTVSGNISFGTPGNHPGVTAEVSWERYNIGGNWTHGQTTATTEPDGDFTLSLEPGTYRLRFSPLSIGFQTQYWNGIDQAGLATWVVVDGSPVTGLNMTLAVMGSISGRAFLGSAATPAGAGAVRVSYQYCHAVGNCNSGVNPTVLTDAEGRFSIGNLENGVYVLDFEYLGGTGYQSPDALTVTVGNSDPTVEGADVILPPAPSITGRVQLGSGNGFAGSGEVIVTAYRSSNGPFDPEFTTSTDADGRYAIRGLAKGTYRLHFDYTGSGDFADEWWDGAVSKASATGFSLMTAEVVRDVRLAAGASISGVVVDSAGAPISGIVVKAHVAAGGSGPPVLAGTATTAADGTFLIDRLPAGAYSLEFVGQAPHTGSYYGSDPIHPEDQGGIQLAEAQALTGLDHVLYRGTSLTGRVTCSRCDMAQVADGLWVILERDMSTTATPRWQRLTGTSATAVWGDSRAANYGFAALVPGRYRMVVESWWILPTRHRSAIVTIEEGQAAVLDFPVAFIPGLDRDFSGDGPADVLARTPSGALRMYTGTGTGSLRAAKAIGSGWTFTSVFSVGDFSGDGFADVMARDAAGNLLLYRGNGAGSWAGSVKVGSGWGPFTTIFSPGDFNGDSYPDVIARTSAGELWLYPGNGNGGWLPKVRVGTGWAGMTAVFGCGDFDGDGKVDVMARDGAGRLLLYRGNGAGGWLGSRLVGTGWNAFDAILGASDLNGDEFADVIARTPSGDLLLYRGNGAGGWLGAVRIGTGWQGLILVP